MILEVGEDFKKEFNWKLENCTTRVKCKLKERYGIPSTHFHWSVLVGSSGFGLPRVSRGPPQLVSVSAASLSRVGRERLERGSASGEGSSISLSFGSVTCDVFGLQRSVFRATFTRSTPTPLCPHFVRNIATCTNHFLFLIIARYGIYLDFRASLAFVFPFAH